MLRRCCQKQHDVMGGRDFFEIYGFFFFLINLYYFPWREKYNLTILSAYVFKIWKALTL